MSKTRASAFGLIILMVATTSWAAPVPDTGQTKCYDIKGNAIICPSPDQAIYGQDANFCIYPMSYSKLDDSGVSLQDSAASWTMVKDNVTGLIWEMKTNLDGVMNFSDLHDADNLYYWHDSNPVTNGGNAGTPGNGMNTEDFIKALNDTRYGGYTDWRLPTIKELTYLVKYSMPYPEPTLESRYFPNTQPSFYWSSNTYTEFTGYAWGVDFSIGYNNGYFKDESETHYIRAVRGGQSGSSGNPAMGSLDALNSGGMDHRFTDDGSYTNNGDGTVTDSSTNLMWQQSTPDISMTWKEALNYCKTLNLGNHTDWRLPTIKELHSLVDYSQYDSAIDTTYFPDTTSDFYWSATTDSGSSDYTWGVDFYDGYDYNDGYKHDRYYIRAVRGGQCGSTATLDGNLLLHAPYLSNANPTSGNQLYWADFVYEFDPIHPAMVIFKWTNIGIITDPSYLCATSTFTDDLKIHIPDVLFPDGITHLWLDMEYSPALSAEGNVSFIATDFGVISECGSSATMDDNLLLHIPHLSYNDPMSGTLLYWADFVYEFNPTYPSFILFKKTNTGLTNNAPYLCETSTLTKDLKIHIPDVLLSDASTHLWLDLEYNPALSTEESACFMVTSYGPKPN
jgi:hypothetical protein